jgi:hypothetical protein
MYQGIFFANFVDARIAEGGRSMLRPYIFWVDGFTFRWPDLGQSRCAEC